MIKDIKILIADDHQLFLDGLVSILQYEKGLQIIALAHNGYEVLKIISEEIIDVCLLDINMPKLNGIETTKLIKDKNPQIKIIILTTYNDNEIITELLQLGVNGYVIKNSSKSELIIAIKEVASGNLYFSEEIHAVLMNDYLYQLRKEKAASNAIILTHREIEVLQLIAKEYTNEKIAKELNISYRTVETHRKNMMQKTKSHNLAGLLKFAYSKGFIK